MYNEIIDLLETGFALALLDLIYGILANEFDQVIYENDTEAYHNAQIDFPY